MKINFTCSCGQQLAASPEKAGEKVRCPQCGAERTVPTDSGDERAIRINKADLKMGKPQTLSEQTNANLPESSESKGTAATGIPPGQSLKANRRFAGKVCAICQDTIEFGEEISICSYCQLPFHAVCWQENGGCGTYGCEASPDAAGRSRPADISLHERRTTLGENSDAAEQVTHRTSGLAVAAFALSIIGLLLLGFILGPIAVILGAVALGRISDNPNVGGKGLAVAGLIIGIFDFFAGLAACVFLMGAGRSV